MFIESALLNIMLKNYQRIFVLAPHTDDGELGCGGAIASFIEAGKEVFYIAFSSAEISVPDGFPKDILQQEVKAATNVLGLPEDHLILFRYEARRFSAYRQDILEDMITLEKKFHPDLVFLPSSFDTHQDHHVVSHEGFRAFKKTSMLGYELPWNNLTFHTSCFMPLNEQALQKKIEALQCYRSQFSRPYMTKEFVESLARMRGVAIHVPYAESFEVIRWIIQ